MSKIGRTFEYGDVSPNWEDITNGLTGDFRELIPDPWNEASRGWIYTDRYVYVSSNMDALDPTNVVWTQCLDVVTDYPDLLYPKITRVRASWASKRRLYVVVWEQHVDIYHILTSVDAGTTWSGPYRITPNYGIATGYAPIYATLEREAVTATATGDEFNPSGTTFDPTPYFGGAGYQPPPNEFGANREYQFDDYDPDRLVYMWFEDSNSDQQGNPNWAIGGGTSFTFIEDINSLTGDGVLESTLRNYSDYTSEVGGVLGFINSNMYFDHSIRRNGGGTYASSWGQFQIGVKDRIVASNATRAVVEIHTIVAAQSGTATTSGTTIYNYFHELYTDTDYPDRFNWMCFDITLPVETLFPERFNNMDYYRVNTARDTCAIIPSGTMISVALEVPTTVYFGSGTGPTFDSPSSLYRWPRVRTILGEPNRIGDPLPSGCNQIGVVAYNAGSPVIALTPEGSNLWGIPTGHSFVSYDIDEIRITVTGSGNLYLRAIPRSDDLAYNFNQTLGNEVLPVRDSTMSSNLMVGHHSSAILMFQLGTKLMRSENYGASWFQVSGTVPPALGNTRWSDMEMVYDGNPNDKKMIATFGSYAIFYDENYDYSWYYYGTGFFWEEFMVWVPQPIMYTRTGLHNQIAVSFQNGSKAYFVMYSGTQSSICVTTDSGPTINPINVSGNAHSVRLSPLNDDYWDAVSSDTIIMGDGVTSPLDETGDYETDVDLLTLSKNNNVAYLLDDGL